MVQQDGSVNVGLPLIKGGPPPPREQLTDVSLESRSPPEICRAIQIDKNMNLGRSLDAGLLCLSQPSHPGFRIFLPPNHPIKRGFWFGNRTKKRTGSGGAGFWWGAVGVRLAPLGNTGKRTATKRTGSAVAAGRVFGEVEWGAVGVCLAVLGSGGRNGPCGGGSCGVPFGSSGELC